MENLTCVKTPISIDKENKTYRITAPEVIEHLVSGGRIARKIQKKMPFYGKYLHDTYKRDGHFFKLDNVDKTNEYISSYKIDGDGSWKRVGAIQWTFQELLQDDFYCIDFEADDSEYLQDKNAHN